LTATPGARRPFQMPRKANVMLDTDPRTDTSAAPPIDERTLVRLTDAAAAKLRELTVDEQNPEIGLRVYVYGGGCSGFRYGMMLDDQPTPDDARIESLGLRVYVDAESRQYLAGSEIDYVDTTMGAGFTVNNPNSVAACGCGSSFRTGDCEGVTGSCSN
jgi:iron-sulfur cluster assembly accessory protein